MVLTKNKVGKRIFNTGFFLAVFTFLLNLAGFVTPYWYIAWPRIHSKFVRIGMWEACFGGYVYPQDPLTKAYFGCWWILSREFGPIREWLQPWWFIICQILSTIIVLMELVACILAIVQYLRGDNKVPRALNATATILLISFILQTIVCVLFGGFSREKLWMPRQHENYLSISYGLVGLSAFTAFFSFICLKIFATLRQIEIDEKLHPGSSAQLPSRAEINR